MELVSMVIKVKYGERVRRFSVHDHMKVVTIVDLKEKVISLFGLQDVVAKQLLLTYLDEDGDVVDLVDADDLHEAVVNQGLNPLLITASKHLNTNSTISNTAQHVVDFFDYYTKQCFALREQLGSEIKSDQTKRVLSLSNNQKRDEASKVKPSSSSLSNTHKRDEVSKVKPTSSISKTQKRDEVSKVKPFSSSLSKLDSCWIEDVSVTDGITMAPKAQFTKIWRLRNNGTAEWPNKTEIICVGGDRMTTPSSFQVQIPVAGLPVDSDVDIAVDLVCPEIPGDYISFWRLSSPTGERFGQYTKVIIQVEEPSEEASSVEEPSEKAKIVEEAVENINEVDQKNLSPPVCSEPVVQAAASRNWFTDVEPYIVSTIKEEKDAFEWRRNWDKKFNPLEGADDDDDILMCKLMPKKINLANKNKIRRKNKKNNKWK